MVELVPTAKAAAALRRAMLNSWANYQDVRVTHETLSLDEVLTIIPMASTRRMLDAWQLLQTYLRGKCPPYVPVRLPTTASGNKVLLSPIIEVINGELVLVDGM